MKRIIFIFFVVCVFVFFEGCKSGSVNDYQESMPVESNTNSIIDYKVTIKEYEAYNKENKMFKVEYVQISGMDDENLQNQINQTLKSSISEWITKDCDWMEKSRITVECKTSKYLSIIYKIEWENPNGKDLLGTFTRIGLTVDLQTGKRVLLNALFNDYDGLKEKLVKYDYGNEISPPIDSDEADEIIHNASITEKEFYEENYKNGHSDYNFLWSKSSYYLTDEQIVIIRDENEFDDVHFDFKQ